MGLLIVGLRVGEPDLLLDPAGWLLVLYGVVRLSPGVERRSLLLGLAALALVVSVPLWWSTTRDEILAADLSLQWALNLPQLGFVAALAVTLASLAGGADDTGAQRWWRLMTALAVLVALVPVVVFGGGVAQLATTAAVLSSLVLLSVIVLCFVHSGRPWVLEPAPEMPPDMPQGRPS